MTAKELMIDDWVYNAHNRQNEQVAEIGSGLVMLAYNDLYEYDEIEPIPLTPDILEKNGFLNDGISFWYLDFRIVLSTSKGVSLVCGRQKRFEYVHELQHALRLAGIDKEIKLED